MTVLNFFGILNALSSISSLAFSLMFDRLNSYHYHHLDHQGLILQFTKLISCC